MSKPMLGMPPNPFAPDGLEVLTLDAGNLVRITKHVSQKPYFGHSKGNRFDDPSDAPVTPYRTCYAATLLQTAIAETVLHDEDPIGGRFQVALEELTSRYVVRFESTELKIADLTGVPLKTLGGNGALSSMTPYDIPQAWARAVYDHPDSVDGFQYVSRHVNTDLAIVLFDRAAEKLKVAQHTPLLDYPGCLDVIERLKISFID